MPDIRSAFTSYPQIQTSGNPNIDELTLRIQDLQARMKNEIGPALSADVAQLKILQQSLAELQNMEKMKAEQAAVNTPRSPQLPTVANLAAQSPIAQAAKKAETPAMTELAHNVRQQQGQPPSEQATLDDGKAFWKWMQTKKAAGGLGSLAMYDYGPDDIRATPLAIKQLMDQNPTYYKQFLAEANAVPSPVPAGPPAPPPVAPVAPPVAPAPPPVAPPVTTQAVIRGPVTPPEMGVAVPPQGTTQPSRKGQDFWAQLGSLAKSTGQSILEILNAGLVGYTGNRVPTAQAQRMDREFQERMAKLSTASQERQLKAQTEAQTARDVTQGAQTEKALEIEHKNRMEELQSQQAATKVLADMEDKLRAGEMTQSAYDKFAALVREHLGGE